MSHLNITRIKFFCDRFFEIMDWIIETGPTKHEISKSVDSDEEKRVQFEELNDFDMDNDEYFNCQKKYMNSLKK